MEQYLIDTNTVIDYLGKKMPHTATLFLNQIVDTAPQISVISKIEILGYNAPTDAHRLLNNFITDILVIGLTDEIVNQTINLRKTHKIKYPMLLLQQPL